MAVLCLNWYTSWTLKWKSRSEMANEMELMGLFEKHVNKIRQSGNNNYVGLCPYHDDNKSSFSFEVTNGGQFICFACDETGNAIKFAKAMGEDPKPFYSDDYKTHRPLINSRVTAITDLTDKAEEYAENLGENYDKEYYIQIVGHHKGGLVFPYFNKDGIVDGLKYHKPNLHTEGNMSKRWYLEWMLDYYSRDECLIIAEGEKDVLTLIHNGYNVLSSSGGCLSVPHILKEFKEFKEIIVVYDNDEAGRKGAEKMAQANYDALGIICQIAKWRDGLPDKFDISDDKDMKEFNYAINHLYNFHPNSSQTKIGAFTIMTDVQSSNTQPKETEWLVEGVLPKEFNSIIAGTTGSKKSYWAMQLGMSLANGEDSFMGRKIIAKNIKVLYVDTEIGQDELLRRYHRIKNKINWRDNGNWLMMSKSGVTVDAWDSIHEVIQNRFHPDLLIIDSLYNSTVIEDFSKASGISKVTNALTEFKDSYGISLLTVGHFNKGESELGLELHRMSGASQLQNWVEWVILMVKTNVPNFNLWKIGKTRGTYHDETILGLSFDDFWFNAKGVVDEPNQFLISNKKKANWQSVLEELPNEFDTQMWLNVFNSKYPYMTERTGQNWLSSAKETPMVNFIKQGFYNKGLGLIDENNIDE